MEGKPRPSEEDTVRCEVCLKQIPRNEAKSREAREYTQYFCGLDCYEKWRRDSGVPVEPEEPEQPEEPENRGKR